MFIEKGLMGRFSIAGINQQFALFRDRRSAQCGAPKRRLYNPINYFDLSNTSHIVFSSCVFAPTKGDSELGPIEMKSIKST